MPPQHPFTCGTHHVHAQAVLSLLETAFRIGNQVNDETMRLLNELVRDAGVDFALKLIRSNAVGPEDVPF